MNFKGIMLSEASQSPKIIYYMTLSDILEKTKL